MKKKQKGKRLRKSKIQDQDLEPKAIQEMKNKKEDKKDKNDKTKKNKKIKKAKLLLIIVSIIIIIFGIKLAISAHIWKTMAKDMTLNENSIVKDTNGNTIATLGSEVKKKVVSNEKISSNLKNAYIAIEDERFYSHSGVDIKRTASAIGSYIIHFGSSSFGGSTITQQLVKNLTGDATDSITRKVTEWWKAWQLETCLSKDEILDTYLNIIYIGPSIYGVEAGSEYYFNKSVQNLSLEECAFLAGINNSPNSYNPFSDKDNSSKIINRTKTVLTKMKELGYIKNEDEYKEAMQNVEKGLKFKNGKIESSEGIYSYHTDALITEITKDICKKYNVSETFATNYINMAGLTIYSTQDSDIQKQMETECSKKKYKLASKNSDDSSQAAMVIIDHKTGNVVGCTGGLGEKTTERSFNRATQSVRQTGSAIKPIAVLLPAIDKKIITAATILDDTEQDFENNYHPTDYSKSLGKITVRRAVESSQNIPFVEIMEKLKPKNSIKYLEKMGVTTLTKEDNSLPLALGGLEKGISPLQMAGAYSTIANDGIYIEPTFYTKIDKKDGTVFIKTSQKTKRVCSKQVAYILKEILTQPVLGENGTATYCKISGVDVAAKTGTTDENYDRWLCGFTPYYTAVTWYGYDQNESIEFNQRNPAGLIWANVMSRIHTGLKGAKFENPGAISTATICSATGKKANTGCPNTYTEYFLWFTVPEICNEHNGSEIKSNENINKNNVTEIIKGITDDIDAKEPERTNTNSSIQQNETQPNKDTKNQKDNNLNNSTKQNYTNEPTNTSTNNNTSNKTNTSNTSTNSTNTSNTVNSNTQKNNLNNSTNTSENNNSER